MFRKLGRKPTFLLARYLHDSKLPTVEAVINTQKTEYIGKDSPKKYDYCKTSSKNKETPEELKLRINNKAEYDDEYSYYLRDD